MLLKKLSFLNKFIFSFFALAVIICIKASGQRVFSITYSATGNGFGYAIKQSGNNYVVAGYSANSTGARSPLLLKIDFSGNILWSKLYVLPGNADLRSLDIAPIGDIIAIG